MYEDKSYKSTYITNVIARVDFVSPISTLEKNIPDKLIKQISKTFPISEPQETIGHSLQIGAEGLGASETFKNKQWNFYSKDRVKHLVIAASYIHVEYTKYVDFETFSAEFKLALEAMEKHFPGIVCARF